MPSDSVPVTDEQWLVPETDRLLDFGARSLHPDGFAWLDARGQQEPERPVALWITCRMTHMFALGHLLGRPGDDERVDHGVRALRTTFHDPTYGGWFASVHRGDPADDTKAAYAHSFVVLAASSALQADRPGAEDLLAEALDVVERRFWLPADGLVADEADRSFATLDRYRGANANMHMVEAHLAAADATGDLDWARRALRSTERLVHGFARDNGWLLPEHYDETWAPQLGLNRDEPAHPFRPFGATVGHLLEWARLVLQLRATLGEEAPGWLLDDARSLFDTAVRHGWVEHPTPGLVYTVDWDGRPVVRQRLHWVVAEALGAATALHKVTGDPAYAEHAQRWWDLVRTTFVDPVGGSWWHELDEANQPSGVVWPGKPDVYHAGQACLLPRLPVRGSLAAGLAAKP